uniref:Uncharacterized protein n=1 Tax=Anguilla anguilla TaxID=7936 RepID=A0A0E9VLD5_ANGAN
MQQKISGTTKN